MSGDPLDAVGQGHAWYGYNLPRLDDTSRQPATTQSSASAPGPQQRRPGGLMADHLFGGVGSQQEAALHVKQEEPVYPNNAMGGQHHQQQHQQQWQQQQQQLQQLQLQQQQQQQQQQQRQQHQQLNVLMQLVDTPPFPPSTSAAPFDLPWSLPPTPASPLMFPSLDLQSQTLMMQQATAQQPPPLPPLPPPPPPLPPPIETESSSCGHANAVAAANAAAGHYFTFDQPNLHHLARPPPPAAGPVGSGVGEAAGTAAAGIRGTPLLSQHSVGMIGTPSTAAAGAGGGGCVGGGAGGGDGGGGAAGGYSAIGNASGLGLWGWCFPTPVTGGAIGPGGPMGAGGAGVVGNLQPKSGVPTMVAAQGALGQRTGAMPLGRSLDEGWSTGDIWGLGGAGAGGIGGSGGGGGAEVPGLVAQGADQEEAGEGAEGGGGGGEAREQPEWGTLNASELRRKERNAREQRRSLMTSQQIDKLRQLLLDCGIQTKTNKSSVLSEVANYMTQLEEQLAGLELERQRWMAETADAPEVARQDPNGGAIDCKQVFAHASVALAMATVEGRLIESNLQFEALSGYLNDEIKQLTLLSLTAPSDLQETFGRLSAMLTDGTGKAPKHVLAKAVLKNKEQDMSLSLTLVRDALGRPKYFLCSLLPNTSRASPSSSSPSPSPAPAPAPAAAAAAAAGAEGAAGGAAVGHSSSCSSSSSSSSRSSTTCTPQSLTPAAPSSVSTTTSDEAFPGPSSSSSSAFPASAAASSTTEATAAAGNTRYSGGAGATGVSAGSASGGNSSARKESKVKKLESSSQRDSGCETERTTGRRSPGKSGGSVT